MQRRAWFIVALLTGLLALAACQSPLSGNSSLPDDGPPIPVSDEAARRFADKIKAAGENARSSGAVNLTITQEEITSALAVAERATGELATRQAQENPEISGQNISILIREPQVYFKENGHMIVRGRIEFQERVQPIRLVMAPRATTGELELAFVEGQLGPIPVPSVIFDQIGRLISAAILAGQDYGEINEITVSEGSMTLSARRSP